MKRLARNGRTRDERRYVVYSADPTGWWWTGRGWSNVSDAARVYRGRHTVRGAVQRAKRKVYPGGERVAFLLVSFGGGS